MLCGSQSLVKHGDGEGIAISLRCRAWTCEECAPIRRSQLINLAASGTPNRMITLTVNPAVGISPADRAAKLARAWRLVVARFRRAHKSATLNYLAIFEATKRGEPHLHILVRGPFISQRWLSAQMAMIIQSPIVDIRLIKSTRQAVNYVTKYVGKAPHRFATCKRYWHTRVWCKSETTRTEPEQWQKVPWEIDERPLWKLVEDWKAARYEISTPIPGEVRYRIPVWVATFLPNLKPRAPPR